MQIVSTEFKIVSRRSSLALKQAAIVKQKLLNIYPQMKIEIIGITTTGDEIQDQSLAKIGGKGLFVKELEHYLLAGKANIAVHSMKDVPAELPSGLALGAILPRADPCDVLLSSQNYNLQQLPEGAVIGTASLRRQAQILALRPDLQTHDLRGNIETRIQKLQAGKYAAIILAAAGLQRLGLDQWLNIPLSITEMLPAVGQGALGIEFRCDDLHTQAFIAALNDPTSACCLQAERAMNAELNGGCQAPVAGYAQIENDLLTLRGLVASTDGKIIYRAQHSGAPALAESIGLHVAQDLIAQGARQILDAWQNSK